MSAADIPLESYTFLPYARSGLVVIATAPAAGSDPLHASAEVSIPLTADGSAAGSVRQRLALRGPGDVLRIDERQVIRRCPPDGATEVEPNYVAHVEFDRPELPWLFTPAAPGLEDRLRPWLALVVLREDRFEPQPARSGLVPSVMAKLSELQPLDDSWAWAHVQVLGGVSAGPLAARLDDQHAASNLSRLLCPRHLEPDTAYLACVVPAIDAGRRAALGEEEPVGPDHAWTLGPAWTRAADDDDTEIELPVFSSWRFRTGAAGDFEALARRLAPTPAPWQVGRRLLDVAHPWPGSAVPSGGLQAVSGPLVSPRVPSASSVDPAEVAAASAAWPVDVTNELRARLTAAADLADAANAIPTDTVPTVGPPVYAGAQTARRRVTADRDQSWFGQLNLQPGHRVVAGLGARVVQHDQEPLMQAAWAQLGELARVNAMLRHAQLARFAGESVYQRHIAPLALGDLLQISRPVHDQTTPTDGAQASTAASLDASATAPAAASARFRAITTRRADPGALLATDEQPNDFQRPYDDSWLMGISPQAAAAVSPAAAHAATGDAQAGPDQLVALGTSLATIGTIADQLIKPVTEPLAVPMPFPLKDWAVQRQRDYVLSLLPAEPTRAPDVAQSLVASIGGLMQVSSDDSTTTHLRDVLFGTLDALHLSPPADQVVDVVKAKLTPQDLVDAIQTGAVDLTDSLDQHELAGVAKFALPDSTLAEAAPQVDAHVLAVAAQEQPGFTELSTAATGLAQIELGVITGTGVDTGVDTVVDTTGVTRVVVPAGDDFGPTPDVAFDEEVQLDFTEQLQQLDLGVTELGQIGDGTATDETLAKVALGTGLLGDDVLADLVRDNLNDDDLAPLVPTVLDVDVAERLAAGCFEPEPVGIDDAIVAAILALLARKQLDPEDVNAWCGNDDLEIMQNILHVHQTLPAIIPTSEQMQRIRDLYQQLVDMTWPKPARRDPFVVDHSHLLAQLQPATTVTARVHDRLDPLPEWVPSGWFADGLVRPLVVPLRFDRAMYAALLEYDEHWLVPGLGADAPAELVTVLESNPRFVEGFLAGLSHEFSRELLWRGYPTDLRGTYFHRFWSADTNELGHDLHELDDGQLGSHLAAGFDDFLTLLVRGELVRRYPSLIALALRPDHNDAAGRPAFDGPGTSAPVVFRQLCSPDVLLVGFRLTVEQVAAAAAAGTSRWWLVLAEHPAAPRFGLDATASGPPSGPDSLAWQHFPLSFGGFLNATQGPPGIGWDGSAADVARLLLQDPFRAAYDLQPLITGATGGGAP